MVMNGSSLAVGIRNKLEALDVGFDPNDQAIAIWTAIGEAIVEHIQNNAEVDDNGTVLIPSGEWTIQ